MTALDNIEIWPARQQITPAGDPAIGLTRFEDTKFYHATLQETVLRMERNSSYREHLPRGSCGVKVHHLEKWTCPAVQLITERAIAMFKRMVKTDSAHIDTSWANVYRTNDYCVPHSHIRAQASIVYMLDPGDEDPRDPLMGKFYFADPRLAYCCQHHPGHMTRLLMPEMKPGSMIIFPGQVMHSVNPYFGARPRITLSWNINAQPIPGDPRRTFEGKT